MDCLPRSIHDPYYHKKHENGGRRKLVPRDLALMMGLVFLICVGLILDLNDRTSKIKEYGSRGVDMLRGSLAHFIPRSEIVVLPIVITDEKSQTPAMKERLASMVTQLGRLGLHTVPVEHNMEEGLLWPDRKRMTYVEALHLCAKLSTKKCLILQDSAILHPNLVQELQETIDGLPTDWEVLHMCPGFTWGRMYKSEKMHFHLNPEMDFGVLNNMPGRHFKYWPNKDAGLGGPVAFVVNSHYAETFATRLANPGFNGMADDIVLQKLHTTRHFIAREPQLCYEDLRGGL